MTVVSYRLAPRPLARYPRPFLAKVTDWFSAYHAWKGERHLEFGGVTRDMVSYSS